MSYVHAEWGEVHYERFLAVHTPYQKEIKIEMIGILYYCDFSTSPCREREEEDRQVDAALRASMAVHGQVERAAVRGQVERAPMRGQVERAPVRGQVERAAVRGQVERAPVRGQVERAPVQERSAPKHSREERVERTEPEEPRHQTGQLKTAGKPPGWFSCTSSL